MHLIIPDGCLRSRLRLLLWRRLGLLSCGTLPYALENFKLLIFLSLLLILAT